MIVKNILLGKRGNVVTTPNAELAAAVKLLTERRMGAVVILGTVVAVWQARFGADASFYENPVTPVGEFADRRWYDTDPVFIVLDLFWHTGEHHYFS